MFFFEKKNQKTFAPLSRGRRKARGSGAKKQRFFSSAKATPK
jgi:hypothetical protein